MQDWAKLSPEQRRQARENYKRIAKAPPEKREQLRDAWAEYQALPPEKRQSLVSANRRRRRRRSDGRAPRRRDCRGAWRAWSTKRFSSSRWLSSPPGCSSSRAAAATPPPAPRATLLQLFIGLCLRRLFPVVLAARRPDARHEGLAHPARGRHSAQGAGALRPRHCCSCRRWSRSSGACSTATGSSCTTASRERAWSSPSGAPPTTSSAAPTARNAALGSDGGGDRRPVLQQADVREQAVQHVEQDAEHDAEEHLHAYGACAPDACSAKGSASAIITSAASG